ncbi:DUF397 domain-containing protein [Nocardia sp. CDC153]|uniref:DUF397 domain-containing protein n=1 Tax=Nocardia sp. CDC153 TaxID=3112167 RepID=UPI002DBFD3A4|nr:DUF397 domain-containing protein [Nocardia sp. CDC153]MEC3952348.1 DUF397 domain-containing protein [Nocardia sp. CDC153]
MSIDLSQAQWFKSTRSTSQGECVEAAHLDEGMVAVRDSKNPGPALVFGAAEWDAFLAATQTGRFDRA